MPSCSSEVKRLRRDPLAQWKRMMENNIECLESSRNIYTEGNRYRSAKCSPAYLKGNVDCLQAPLYDARHPNMDKKQIRNLSEKLDSCESLKQGDTHCRITRHDVPNQNYNIIADTEDSKKKTMDNQKGTRFDNSETLALCVQSLTLGINESVCDEDIQKSLHTHNIKNTVCHKIDMETDVEERQNFLNKKETIYPTDKIIDTYCPHSCNDDFVCGTHFDLTPLGNIESDGANTYTQNTECMGSHECAAFSRGARMFTVDKHKEVDRIFKHGKYLPSKQNTIKSTNTGCKTHNCFQGGIYIDNGQNILSTGKHSKTCDHCFLNIRDVDDKQSVCNTDKDRKDRQSYNNGDEGKITPKTGTDCTTNNNLANAQSSLSLCKDCKTNNNVENCKTNNNIEDCKTDNNVEDCKTNNNAEDCKTKNNVEDCKTDNNVEVCKTNNNVEDCKTNNNVEDFKTNNNVEDCKTDNNVEDCKANNNVEDFKTNNNVENCKTDNNVEDCKTNNNAEDCKTNNNVEDFKTNNNVEDFKTDNNAEDCKTNNNAEDCKTNNNVEDFKTNNNVEDCKTNNNAEDCKTNNNVEDFKTNNNVEDCKTDNNAEDCKANNNVDNAYSPFNAWKDCKTRDVNNGQSRLNGSEAGTQESRKDENFDVGRCLMTTDQNRFSVNMDSSANFKNAYDNQNITNKLEYAVSSSERVLSDERKVLEIPQTCANVDFDLCSEDINGHTTNDFSDINGIKMHVNICPKEISHMKSEVDCLQNTIKHTKYTIACRLSSCDITTSAVLDDKINPVKERCGTLIPHILTSEFTNTDDKTQKNKCITNPDSVTSVYVNTSLANSLHKTDANNSVIICCSGSSLIKKSVGISRSMCTLILPNVLLHKSHRQKRAYRSSSLENIVEDDMKRSQTCQINNMNHVVKNRIPDLNIRCSKDEHISSVCREVVLSDHLTAEYTKNCKLLKQKSLEQISQNFSLSPALNRKQIMLDYKQKSDKTLKNLTRNPMTQWTRLMNDNIEAVFRIQSDPQNGFKNFEASNFNRSQNLNTEEIKSGRAEFANMQIRSQKHCFKNNCSSESSGINSSEKMYGLHDSLQFFEEKDRTDCLETDSTCFRVKCHAMEANSLSTNILEESKLEISEPLGTDNQYCYSYRNDCKDSYRHEKDNDKKDDKIMSDEKYGNVYENHETAAKQDVDKVTTLSSSQCNNNYTAVVFTHNSIHETESIEASKDIIKKHTHIIFLEEGKEGTKNIRVCKKHEQYSEDKCVQIEECVKCGFRHNHKVEGDCRDEDIYSLDCHHENRTEMIVDEGRVQNMHTSKTEDCEVDLTKFEGRDSEVAWTKFGGGDCEVHWKEFVGVDSEGNRTHFGDRDCVVDWTKLGGGDCEIEQTHFIRRYCEVDWTKFGGGDCEVDGIEFEGRDSRSDQTQFREGDCKAGKKKLVEDNWEYLQTSQCLNIENTNSECYDFITILRQDDCSTEKENEVVDSVDYYGRKNHNGRECNISKVIHSEMSEKQCTDKERNSLVMNDSDSYDRNEVSKDEVSAQYITTNEVINISESSLTTVASQDYSTKGETNYKSTSHDKCMTNCVIEASETVKTNECETNIFPGVTVSEFDCHYDEIDVDIAADTLGMHAAKEYVHIPAKNQLMRQCPNVCPQDTTMNTRDEIDTQIFSCGIPAYENLHDRNSGKLATNSSILDVSGSTETYSNFSDVEEHIVTCTQHSNGVASLHVNAALRERTDETTNSLVQSVSRIIETFRNFSNEEENIITCTHHSGSVAPVHDDNIMGERTDETKAYKPVIELSCGNLSYKNPAFVNRNVGILSLLDFQHSTRRDNELYESTSADNLTTRNACRLHLCCVWTVKPNTVRSKSDTEIRSATNRKCVTENESATNGLFDTEVGCVNKRKSGTRIRLANNAKFDTGNGKANSNASNTEIKSASNGMTDNEISYDNSGKFGTQIRYINSVKSDIEIVCADNEMYDTEIRSVNNGKSYTENGSTNNDKSDTEFRIANNVKSYTQIRSVNNRKCNTEISFANNRKCDTDIRDVNKGKCETDIRDVNKGKCDTDIRNVNKGKCDTDIRDVNKGKCDTDIRDVNKGKCNTDIRDVNKGKCDTDIRNVNKGICDTDIKDVNKGKCDADITCDSGKTHAEISCSNKGISSVRIKCADDDEQCLKPVAERLGHVRKDRYDEKDNHGLLQFVEKAATEMTQLNTSQIKEIKADHMEESKRTVKDLTRNPVTQWTRLVNANIEAMARKKADTTDTKSYGSSTYEPCRFSKRVSLQTTQHVNIENIQSESLDINNVHFKPDGYCFEPVHMKECSELINKHICSFPTIIGSSNSQECNTACLKTVSGAVVDTDSDNNIETKYKNMNMSVSQKIKPEKLEVAERAEWQWHSINVGRTGCSFNQDCTESHHYKIGMNTMYAQQEVKGTVDENCGCVISENMIVNKVPLSVSQYTNISGETRFSTKPVCQTVYVETTIDTRQEDSNIPSVKKCTVYSEDSSICNVLGKQCDPFNGKSKNELNSDEVCSQDFTNRRISDVSESLKINGQSIMCGFRDSIDGCGIVCNDRYGENKIKYKSASYETIQTKQPDTVQALQKDISDCELNSCFKNSDFEMKCMPSKNEDTKLVSVHSDKEINVEGEENFYKDKVINASCKSETQVLSDDITIHLEENLNKEKVVNVTSESETQVLSGDITISHEENQTMKTRTKAVMPFIINSIARANKGSDNKITVNYTQQSCNHVSLLDGIGTKYKYIDKRENYSSKVVDCEDLLSKKNSFRISRSDHTLLLPTFSRSVFKENRLYKSTSANNFVTYDKHKTGRCLLKVMKHKKFNRMSNSRMKGAETGSSIDKLKVELSGDGCRPGCIAEDKTTSLQGLQKTTANVNHLHSLNSKDSEGKNFMVHTKESFSEAKNCIVLTHESLSEGKNYMMHTEKSLSEEKNYMVHTEKSLSEGKNYMVHIEKSLFERKNNMVHTEKSLFERKNNMVYTEKSLFERKNNMVHTEKSLSEEKNYVVHTEKSLSEGKNYILHTEKSLFERNNNMLHTEKSLSEGKNYVVHTEKSLSEGKNYILHTEKSLFERKNNMVHTEKSLSEGDNNMVHTEKSLFERKNNMVHTEKSLSEGDNNMVHTEKSLSEGDNNMVHTEKSLSEGDNNMVYIEKSLSERKNSVMHTEEPLPEGRNFIVHTDDSNKPLKHLTRNHVPRTLKQLTRNPMTQWTRLVNNNIEAVSKTRVGESELSNCGGGDFEADIFGKSKNYIFPEKVLGTVFKGSEFAESALEKLYLSEPESAKSTTEKLLSESESAKSTTEKLLSESESATSSTEKLLRESESVKRGTEKYLNESQTATSSPEKHLSESESVKSGTEKYFNELESAKNKTELYFSEPESAKRGRERIYLSESDSAKSGTDTYLNESESAKRGKEMVYLNESESAKCAKNKLYLREPDSAKLGTEKLNLSTSDSARSATGELFLKGNDTASVQEVDVMSRISNTSADCMEDTPKEKVKPLSLDVCLCEQTKAVEPLHVVHDKHILVSKILSVQNKTADGTLAEKETCCTKNTLSTFDSVPLCEVMATLNPIPGCVQYVTCKSDNPETDSPLWQISSGRTDAELQCISISQRQIQQKCILNQFSSVNLARPMWYSKRPLKTVDVTVYVHKSKGWDRLSSTKKILNCDEVYSRGKVKHQENNSRTDKSKNQDNIFSRDRQKYPSTDKSKVQNIISCADKRKYQEKISRTDKKEKMAVLHSSKEKDIVSSKDRNILKLGIAAQISGNYDRISSNLSTRHAQCSATTQGRALDVLDELSCEDTSTNSGWSRFWYFMAHMFTGFSKPLPHQNDVENQELMIIKNKQMGQKLKDSDHKVHCFKGKWGHKYNESGVSLFNISSLHNKKHMLENSICITNDSDSKKHRRKKVITDIDLITGEGNPDLTEYDKMTTGSKVKLSQEKKSSNGTDWREPTENILFRDQVEDPWSETDCLSEDKNIEKCSYVLVPQDYSNSDTQVRQTHDKSECQTVPSGNTNTFTDNKEFIGLGKCKQGLHKSQIPVFASRFSKSIMSDLDNEKITRRCHQKEADSLENKGQRESGNETTVTHHNLLDTEIFELMKEDESEQNYFSACQISADKTFNVSAAESADTTAVWKEFSQCHGTSEMDGTIHKMGAAETDGILPVRTSASIKKDTSNIIEFLNSSARIRDKFSINNAQSMSVIGNTESEQEHLCLHQKSENQTCNIFMDESEDKTACYQKCYQCENKSEDDATLHEIGLLETGSKYSILPVKKSASIEDDSSNIIQFLDTPARIKEKVSINTESMPDDEHLGDYFQNLVTLNQKVTADIEPGFGQHGQGCSRDECCDLTESQLLQSSLECLLEMLLQRGKVTHAFITNNEGEVLAKTAKCSVTAQDINSILFSLFSSYRGMVKITVFSDVYTCFKHDEHSLVGRASTDIFVARRGQQSIVVGFCDALTPGSCVKEVQEISELLNKRGL